MTAWGPKVQELLKEHKKSRAWLAREAKIGRSTITNWLNNPEGVRPEPAMVGKVAKAFGLKARDLAAFAGYPITASIDENDRKQRWEELGVPPGLSQAVDEAQRELSAVDQDTLVSMMRTFTASRRKAPPKS
jgi:transcriptional regulator with XRE-family HTH domain